MWQLKSYTSRVFPLHRKKFLPTIAFCEIELRNWRNRGTEGKAISGRTADANHFRARS
jgi:hypothetical protein